VKRKDVKRDFRIRVWEFLLERLYTEFAWAYDWVSWIVSLGRWTAWQRVALRYLVGERVLEVGCGTGHLLRELAGRVTQVVGCDRSATMLRQTRRRVGEGAPLARAQAQELPFAAASFDTLICTFPAPYIADPRTWAEFARVLAPAGRVVVVYGVSVGKKTPGQRLVRFLLQLGRTDRTPVQPAWAGSGLHVAQQIVMEGADRVGLLLGVKG
jgi:ubiquinone/menaquinone biosynthesis C-methylase UbiE